MKLNSASFLIPLLCLSLFLFYIQKFCVYVLKIFLCLANLIIFCRKCWLCPQLCYADIKSNTIPTKNPKTLKTNITKLMIPVITICGNSWAVSIQPQLVIHTLYYYSGSTKNWQCKIGFVELNPILMCIPVSSVMLL